MTDQLASGKDCTANQINTFIGGKHQGGIRYSGTFPDLDRIGVIIGGGKDAIYEDEIHGSTIRYVGEGLTGDQKLRIGNRALVWAHLTGMQVHVFINEAKNRYRYRGPHRVKSVSTSIEPDINDGPRGVFVFILEADGG